MNILDKGYYMILYDDNIPTEYSRKVSLIFNSVINCVHNIDVKNNLLINHHSYIIGKHIYDFSVFQPLFDIQTMDGRDLVNVSAFAADEVLPGFISTDLFIKNDFYNEDVIAHEMLHSIEAALPLFLKQMLINIFNKYAVINDIYDISAYAFLNHHEMFAVFGTVFLGVNERTDITGSIVYDTLKEYLPDLYTFFHYVFIKKVNLLYTSCSVYSHRKTYCNNLLEIYLYDMMFF